MRRFGEKIRKIAAGVFWVILVISCEAKAQSSSWAKLALEMLLAEKTDNVEQEDHSGITAFPEQQENDETGRSRRLHEYLGEFDWHSDARFQSTREDAMACWLLQLSNFNYDHDKIRLGDRTWQTVGYTWRIGSGVCRDSATVLSDMLETSGYDARLVAGDRLDAPGALPTDDTGHAWVVISDRASGAEYLLESTQDFWDYSMRVPPRTYTAPEYIPVMQVTYDYYLTRPDNHWTSSYTEGWIHKPTGNPTCFNNH